METLALLFLIIIAATGYIRTIDRTADKKSEDKKDNKK